MRDLTIILALMFIAALPLGAQDRERPAEGNPAVPVPEFTWDSEVHDFGVIELGVPVKATFTFTNTGKAPLVLKSVRKSCGCTTVEWPREPILPGRSGSIMAEYDASEPGTFNKKLTVLANTAEGMHTLTLKGSVK